MAINVNYVNNVDGVIEIATDNNVPRCYFGTMGNTGKILPYQQDEVQVTIGGDTYEWSWENLTIDGVRATSQLTAINLLTGCFTGVPYTLFLGLTFNDTVFPVGDPTSVQDWNTFFDLPNFGNVFSAVDVDNTTIILTATGGITIARELFYQNPYLIQIKDNGVVVFVDDNAFVQTGLTYIGFPSLTRIGVYSFENCESLLNTELPLLKYIGSVAFGECYSLGSLTAPLVTYIGDGAFASCTGMSYLNMPLVEYIGSGAFENCPSMESFDFPLVTELHNSTFSQCTNITSVNMPSLYKIANSDFAECNNLTSIDFPLLTEAGNYCFGDCYAIQSFNLPNLTVTGSEVFYYCESVVEFDFPKLQYLGYDLFDGCSSAQIFNLPSAIEIGDYCFYYCISAQSIYMPQINALGTTTGDNGVFEGIAEQNITVTLPRWFATCDEGNPDGDIIYLQDNNTATINYI